MTSSRAVIVVLVLLSGLLGSLVVPASGAVAAPAPCAPCAEAARSLPRFDFAVSRDGRQMLIEAARRTSLVLAFVTMRACQWDSVAVPPAYHVVTTSRDTLALWRTALEHLAAAGGAAGDSAGAVGISLLSAIDRADAHPLRVTTAASGRLVRERGRVWLRTCGAPLEVLGDGADSLATRDGAEVWMQGECRDSSAIRWVGGHALGRERIDLFVMGRCPFARRLEANFVPQLAALPPKSAPEVAVHYLLFWDPDKPGETRAASLHGEPERLEDGVQILLRDTQPTRFWAYVALRAKSEDPWEVLAQRAGVGWQAIDEIRRRLARDLDALLLAEHRATLRDFPKVEGSPTVFWQGLEVRDIGKVPGFTREPAASSEKCLVH